MPHPTTDNPQPHLGAVEARFAGLIWDHAPLPSGELVRLAQEELGWKKSTTYTVLRRLCQRGLFENREGLVTALLSREEFAALQSRQFVQETFQGSLPRFLAAFSGGSKLSPQEVEALQRFIDENRG